MFRGARAGGYGYWYACDSGVKGLLGVAMISIRKQELVLRLGVNV